MRRPRKGRLKRLLRENLEVVADRGTNGYGAVVAADGAAGRIMGFSEQQIEALEEGGAV